MNEDRMIDRARAWIGEGPTRAPARAIDAALQKVAAMDQDAAAGLTIGSLRLTRLSGIAGIVALGFLVGSAAIVSRSVTPVIGPGASATNQPLGTAVPSTRPTEGSGVTIVDPGRSFRPYEGTSAAWMAQIAACLRDKGWDATIEWDGGMQVDTPGGDEQRAALRLDQYACWDVFGGPRPFVPPTDAEIQAIYEYWAHDLRDCLIGMGYTIGEPPTEQEFVDSYPRTEGIVESGPWSPYLELPENLGPHSWREVNETCPQAPPG